MAAACGFHPDVVAFSVEILQVIHVAIRLPWTRRSLRGSRLTILRVEIELICGERFAVGAIVNVEVEGVSLDCTLVCYRDARMLLERHGEEAVERFVGADCERGGLVEG